jgi:hypothetical protein
MFWGLHDAARVLATWSQFVPPERVHLITVPPRTAPSGDTLWQRFCLVTDLDPTRYADIGGRRNRSMGVTETELLRRMNRRLRRMRHEDYDRLVRRLLAERILGSRSARLSLPPEHFEWAAEWSANLVAELASSGYDIIGDLTELVPRPEDHSEHVSPTALTDADLAPAAIRATTGLLRHAAKQNRQIKRLRRATSDGSAPALERDPLSQGTHHWWSRAAQQMQTAIDRGRQALRR